MFPRSAERKQLQRSSGSGGGSGGSGSSGGGSGGSIPPKAAPLRGCCTRPSSSLRSAVSPAAGRLPETGTESEVSRASKVLRMRAKTETKSAPHAASCHCKEAHCDSNASGRRRLGDLQESFTRGLKMSNAGSQGPALGASAGARGRGGEGAETGRSRSSVCVRK